MKKIITIMISLLFILSACANSSESNITSNDNTFIEVKDSAGRIVQVPTEINRIAATYAATGHILALLGHGEKIVAVPGGLKRDKLFTMLLPNIKDAAVPKESSKLNIEELARVTPDVIFVNMNTYADKGQVKLLEQLKIPYVVIHYDSIEEQMDAIMTIAKIVGEEDRANEYIQFYEDTLHSVEEIVKDIPENERLQVFHSINEATRTSVPETIAYEWLAKTGVINVSNGEDFRLVDNKHFVSLEQILLWDPDVILVNEVGVDEYILSNPQWKDLKAVLNEQVFILPNGLTRWGHPDSIEVPLATLWTAKKLYPDRFIEIDIEHEVKSYYEKFFSITLTDEQIQDILLAKGMRLSRGEVDK